MFNKRNGWPFQLVDKITPLADEHDVWNKERLMKLILKLVLPVLYIRQTVKYVCFPLQKKKKNNITEITCHTSYSQYCHFIS